MSPPPLLCLLDDIGDMLVSGLPCIILLITNLHEKILFIVGSDM